MSVWTISTLIVRNSKQMQINTAGYGKKQQKNRDTGSIRK